MTQAARTDTTPAISVADLTVKDGDERVSHKRLAAALELKQHQKLRLLVERNIVEFQRFGEVSSTVDETTAKGGRPGKLLWLNEGQAILAAVRSDAPRAAEVRYQVITAFMAYRQQRLAKPVHVREHDRRTSTTIDKAVSLKRSADRLEKVADRLDPRRPGGVSMIYVDGEPVLVDMTDFDMRDGGEAVAVKWDGTLIVTRPQNIIAAKGLPYERSMRIADGVVLQGETPMGRRSGYTPWRGSLRDKVLILGRVVSRGAQQANATAKAPDFLRHLYVAVMNANLRVEGGEEPNFGKALESILSDRLTRDVGGKPSGKMLLATPSAQCRGRRAPFKADILRLIDEGKSNREIARATGATYPTVTHWRRMVEDGLAA